jgi:hypothetical protein
MSTPAKRSKKPKQLARVVEFDKGESLEALSSQTVGIYTNCRDATIAVNAVLAMKYDAQLAALDYDHLPDYVQEYIDPQSKRIRDEYRGQGLCMTIVANWLARKGVGGTTFFTHMIDDW